MALFLKKNPLPPNLVRIGKDLFKLLWIYPGWMIAAILSTVIVSALEPTKAWMSKSFLDDLKDNSDLNISDSLHEYIIKFGGIFLALALLNFGDKIIDKIFETKMILCLQRTYLERRKKEETTEDISRILFDCSKAKPAIDVIHKDGWKIVSQVISVVVWQVNLAPEWIPALLIAVLPPMFMGFIFSKFIQQASLEMLETQQEIASSTSKDKNVEFARHQDSFLKQVMKLEMFKQGTEVLVDFLTWFGLFILVIVATILPIDILPQEITAGDLVLFWINLNLLSKPLGEIAKVYNKARESYPALTRVLTPL
ncbi:MAG: ABC transporter ATP-binding protein [Cyanobacterium sp. T60_A2020_053]|nr:ABC transporter ATP-binding protein [Cyanobacterium sp. T60_A2020_053]